MELVRHILLAVEREDAEIVAEGFTSAQIDYHVALLIEEEYLRGRVIRGGDDEIIWHIGGLTWKGHEFADLARSEKVWLKAVQKTRDTGIDVSISVFKEVLTAVARSLLGF